MLDDPKPGTGLFSSLTPKPGTNEPPDEPATDSSEFSPPHEPPHDPPPPQGLPPLRMAWNDSVITEMGMGLLRSIFGLFRAIR
ncbi:MAG: hypothetical protein ACKO9Q_13735, partial [Pirellula sp.]